MCTAKILQRFLVQSAGGQECPPHTSLLALRRQLPLRRRHLIPHRSEILFHDRIVRIGLQCQCEPAIGARQVARHAVSSRIHRADRAARLGVLLVRCHLQILDRTRAVSRPAPSVKVALASAEERLARISRVPSWHTLCAYLVPSRGRSWSRLFWRIPSLDRRLFGVCRLGVSRLAICKFRLRDRRLFFGGSSSLLSLILARRRFRSRLLCAVCFVLFRRWSLSLRRSIRRLGSRCRHFRHRFPIRGNADVVLVSPPARSSESRKQHNRQQGFLPSGSGFVRLGIRSQTGKSPLPQNVHIALIQTEQGRAADRWNWLAGVRPGPCWRGWRCWQRRWRRHDTSVRS